MYNFKGSFLKLSDLSIRVHIFENYELLYFFRQAEEMEVVPMLLQGFSLVLHYLYYFLRAAYKLYTRNVKILWIFLIIEPIGFPR